VAQHVDGAVAVLGEERAPRGEGRVRHAEVVDERDDDGPHLCRNQISDAHAIDATSSP
jgi:hypothetical protein